MKKQESAPVGRSVDIAVAVWFESAGLVPLGYPGRCLFPCWNGIALGTFLFFDKIPPEWASCMAYDSDGKLFRDIVPNCNPKPTYLLKSASTQLTLNSQLLECCWDLAYMPAKRLCVCPLQHTCYRFSTMPRVPPENE